MQVRASIQVAQPDAGSGGGADGGECRGDHPAGRTPLSSSVGVRVGRARSMPTTVTIPG
jgi:hypothetical protein